MQKCELDIFFLFNVMFKNEVCVNYKCKKRELLTEELIGAPVFDRKRLGYSDAACNLPYIWRSARRSGLILMGHGLPDRASLCLKT